MSTQEREIIKKIQKVNTLAIIQESKLVIGTQEGIVYLFSLQIQILMLLMTLIFLLPLGKEPYLVPYILFLNMCHTIGCLTPLEPILLICRL